MALCWHILPTDPIDTKPYVTWGSEEICPVCHPDLYEPYGKPVVCDRSSGEPCTPDGKWILHIMHCNGQWIRRKEKMDPLNPIPIVRRHQSQWIDSFGDTWEVIDGIETKVAYKNPVALMKRQDGIRRQIRAGLDELGLRDNLGEMEVTNPMTGEKTFVEGPSEAFNFSMRSQPTDENLRRLEREHNEEVSRAKREIIMRDGGDFRATMCDAERNQITKEHYQKMLAVIYAQGGSCDIAYINVERAYQWGFIGPWRYRWLKLVRALRRSLGTWGRNANSGARSARRTAGTPPTGRP